MRKQKFAINKIRAYVNDIWYDRQYLRYRSGSPLDADLDNTEMWVDKIKLLNNILEDYSSTDENETCWFWPNLFSRLENTNLTENYWKTLWLKILGVLDDNSDRVIPRIVITILRKLNWRYRQYSDYCRANNMGQPVIGEFDIDLLSNETKTKMTTSFNEIATIIKNKFENLPKFKRPNNSGEWAERLLPDWPKFGYHSHRNIIVKPLSEDKNVMKYGIELEGAMSNGDYQAACDEMSKTPFEGGFILDERNLIMGTEDGSLPRDTGVEWVMAPFSFKKGMEFWTKVEEILAKHNFRRTCPDKDWGLHVHLDANKFVNEAGIEKFINKVYSYNSDSLHSFFERGFNSYCSWDKDDVCYYQEDWKPLIGQFTKDNKQLGFLEKIFKLRSRRYNLINCTNIHWDDEEMKKISKGTVEVRGFYANVKISKAINVIKDKFLEGVVVCA